MAQPTGTYATNDMVGVREDLVDVIYDISPTETPFLNMVPHVEANNVQHEWQTDSLAAASGSNVNIEGADAVNDTSTATTRLNNRTQILDKVAQVTGTAGSVNSAGRGDEMDYQMLKRGREIRRDLETSLLASNAKVTGTDAVAGEMAGVPAWVATNTSAAGDGADPTGDGTDTRTDGTQRAFTEPLLQAVALACFNSGGMPDVLMLGGFNRQVFSGFTPATVFQKAEDVRLHATFDVYVSDFGAFKVIPNRFQRARDGHLLQTDMWAVAFMPGREFVSWPLAKTGDSTRRQVLAECTLEARQEAASGIIADLTTS